MSKFKIKVARIETTGRGNRDGQVCITFQIDRGPINFELASKVMTRPGIDA
jgi:hypothetical protein